MLNEGWRRHERGTDIVVGLRRDPQPAPHRRAGARPPGDPAGQRSTTAARRSRRWTSTPILARHPEVALVDELAHTNVPGSPQREALAGRRGAARRRDRRHLHREHPAPRVAQRRRRGDHRHPAAGDDPRRGRPRRRADRAGRLHPRGAAPADGPREHLRARQGRRRARQLLPARQPGRPPGARAALGGRPRRRVAPGVPGAARHRGAVGDAGARRRRRHRRARQRQPHPPGVAHREPVEGRSRRRARASRRRARHARRRRRCSSTASSWRSWAAPTARWSAPTWPRPSCRPPASRAPPSSCSARAAGRAGTSSPADRSSAASSGRRAGRSTST